MHVFEVVDKTGRTIYCSQERWSHIVTHHGMASHIEHIRDCLVAPDVILRSEQDEQARLYYKLHKNRKEWLFVSVKYLNGKGYTITSFYTNKVK